MDAKVASRALLVVCVALGVDMLVYGAAVPVLPAVAAKTGTGASAISALFAVYAGALLAFTPVAAWIAHRFGLRRAMLGGLLGLCGATVLFALATSMFWTLVAARALQGTAAATTWTAGFALLARAYPAERRGWAMGVALSTLGIGTLVGPLFGGLLYQHGSAQLVFFTLAGLALADGVLRVVLVTHDPPCPVGEEGSSFDKRWLVGGRTLGIVGASGLGAAVIASVEPILPLRLMEDLNARPGIVGALFAIAVLASSAVTPSFGAIADRVAPRPLLIAGLVAAALGMAGLAVATALPVIAVALTAVACGVALILVPTLPMVARLAEASDPPAYGYAYGLYTFGYAAGLFAGPLLAAAASAFAGFRATVVIEAGVLGALCFALAAQRSFAGRRRAVAR